MAEARYNKKFHLVTEFRPWRSIQFTPCGLRSHKFGSVYRTERGGFFQRRLCGDGYVDVSVGKICKNCLKAIGYPLRGKETK